MGSIISLVLFENGSIRAKSKMSFTSEQAVLAQKFYDENYNYREFVKDCFTADLTPVFELVGYENQIVVNYEEPYELRLIQIRRDYGTYLSLDELEKYTTVYKLKCADSYNTKMLEKISSKYTVEELKTKIGNNKFPSLKQMIGFLSN